MFGYVVINEPEMKIKDYNEYRSYYCGLCKSLKSFGGEFARISLSYDCTFLVILLTGLYEPQTTKSNRKCIVHPLEKHPVSVNEITDYVAELNLMLSYYNCMDDWEDDRKVKKLAYAKAVKRRVKKAELNNSKKAEVLKKELRLLHDFEKRGEESIDEVAGSFGRIMAEFFSYKDDIFAANLRKMGFYLGKFIYILDAYEDLPEDIKAGNYNPLRKISDKDDFETTVKEYLTMMMAECCKSFELLPIIENVDILRNILYSGVWTRYEIAFKKKAEMRKND